MWNMKKLVILDFGIFSIQTGLASFELAITTKEPGGIKKISYIWNIKELEKFYQDDISPFNKEVNKIKNIKDRLIVYNVGEKLAQTSLYFKKDEWEKFYSFFEQAYKNYLDQKKVYAGF